MYRDRHNTSNCCTIIEYHTDGTLHSRGNVQGLTHIKNNFNFVQGHSDKATLWIIELLTSQLKTRKKECYIGQYPARNMHLNFNLIPLFIADNIIKNKNGVRACSPLVFTCICMQLGWAWCDKVETISLNPKLK